jgi:cell division protein DivIC
MLASEGLQRLKAKASREAPARKKRQGVTMKAITVLLVVYMVFLYGSQELKYHEMLREKARVEQQIRIYQTRNDLLKQQISYLSSPEYVEKAARDQLGFTRDGEVPYITKTKPVAQQ